MIKYITRDPSNPDKLYVRYNPIIKEEILRIRDLEVGQTTLDDIKTLLLVLVDTVSDEGIIDI